MKPLTVALVAFPFTLTAVALISRSRDTISSAFSGYDIAIALIALAVIAGIVRTDSAARRRERQVWASRIGALEAAGLLLSTIFQATRAFQVAEADDEGLHFFIELDNGNVLYLNGQYLYDYQSDLDDDSRAENGSGLPPLPFPCTEFMVWRHRGDGSVVHIECRGGILLLEQATFDLQHIAHNENIRLHDGDIIADRSYQELRVLFAVSDHTSRDES